MVKRKFLLIIVLSLLVIPGDLKAEEKKSSSGDVFTYDDKGKRNPFWELLDDSGNIINYGGDIMVSDMQLEGIMLGANGNNVAIINGNVVQKDDMIGDFLVFDIQPNAVVLIKDDKRFELRIKKEE